MNLAATVNVVLYDRMAKSQQRRRDLDLAWRAVDACGGAYNPEEEASRFAEGHKLALTTACAEIEKLGGRPS